MRSLRLRLLFGTLFWIAASILVAGWGLGRLFQQHVATQFHTELRTHLDQLTAHLESGAQGQPRLKLPLSDPRFNKPFSGFYWQIDRPTAVGIARSRSLWDQVLVVPADVLTTGELHRHRITGPEGRPLGMAERSLSLDEQPLRLIVAADEALMVEPVGRFKRELWLALAILGLGLALAAGVQVLVGLAPLRSLQAALGRVRTGMAQRLEGNFPSELMPLAQEFNSVLAQNAEVVARARTQAGNLAHALKTPLAVLANAARASENSDPENSTRALARLVGLQVDVARQQVDHHLARANAAVTARLPGARTRIVPVIEGLVRTLRRIYAERTLELHVETFPDALAFRGEAQDLEEMLGNLIDNACKWARSGVRVRVEGEDGWVRILVDDDGRGVAEAQKAAILQRGVRADEQIPGTGLGLAIVADLAQLYSGELVLVDSPLGGLQAILRLPAVS